MRPLTRSAGLLALALFAAAPARAASWWRLPVWGAEVRAFAVDPFDPGTVYCGTSRGNFYGSKDCGRDLGAAAARAPRSPGTT